MIAQTKEKSNEYNNKTPPSLIKKDKKVREKLKEEQIDDMVDDSFPASDPPSTY